MENKRYSVCSNYDNADWERILKILIAYAHFLLRNLKIKRGGTIEDLAYDFAMKAIISYLENKTKFDPARNPDLVLYLKHNILKQLIFNFNKSSDNNKTTSIPLNTLEIKDAFISNIELEESIDINTILPKIREEVNKDYIMAIVFIARYDDGMKRSEICETFEIDTATYDNALKRLKRIALKYLN